MIQKFKTTTFKQVDFETWKKVAVDSLRGTPLEDLVTQTAEEIEIQPLYTKELLEDFSYEESNNMINAVRQEGKEATWTVAQYQYASNGEDYLKQLKDSLSRGVEAIVYDGRYAIEWEAEQLKELAKLAQEYPVYGKNISSDDHFTEIFKHIPVKDRANIQGAISGEFVLSEEYKQVRTVGVDTLEIHNEGADSVTELAVTLAKAAEHASSFKSFEEFEKKLFVRFAIDTHFFMEIAKLRAFRLLWRTFGEAYGETGRRSVPVFSENSLRSYSKLDSYVNLLRAGNEALSAVLGGTDFLAIHPHDILTGVTPTSLRLARNVQLVIKEETLVGEVIDPAGGSYFIEVLTKELVEKAWALFQKIQEDGGYKAFVSSGKLENRLKLLQDFRTEQVVKNKKSLIGTNSYADLSTPFVQTEDAVEVGGRLAKPYEELRGYFEEKQPKIVLLTFGKIVDFKPRADFVGGFLATGGLESEWSPAFTNASEAQNWIAENEFDYGIVCTGAKDTETIMKELLKDIPKSLWIDVAGKYEENIEKEWLDSGVSGFIYKGQNQIEKLLSIKNNWKGA